MGSRELMVSFLRRRAEQYPHHAGGTRVALFNLIKEAAMAKQDEEFRRGVDRPQFNAYDGVGDEHGEPQEYPYGSGFDKAELGRWARQDRERIFSQPYDEWSSPGYVFYAGKGYHREFIDPYAISPEPEAGSGGQGFLVEPDLPRGRFTGRGPRNYVRSDERIGEEVNNLLAEHGDLDATNITVQIAGGEVTLEGQVDDRHAKRLAEDLAQSVRGVRDVHNRLRIEPRSVRVDVDVEGRASHSGTGVLTENLEVPPRTRPR
jgi:hypothetical protein